MGEPAPRSHRPDRRRSQHHRRLAFRDGERHHDLQPPLSAVRQPGDPASVARRGSPGRTSFAHDSLLEPSVPRQRPHLSAIANHLSSHRLRESANLDEVLPERAPPTTKGCRCLGASSRLAAPFSAVSPCNAPCRLLNLRGPRTCRMKRIFISALFAMQRDFGRRDTYSGRSACPGYATLEVATS